MATAKQIVASIAAEHGLTIDDLRRRQRGDWIDVARARAYKELRTRLNWSCGEIGQYMGGRSRQAVHKGIASLESRRTDDEAMAMFLRQRRNYLSGVGIVYEVVRALDISSQEAIVLSILIRNAPKPLTLGVMSEYYDHAWHQLNGNDEKFVCESTIKSAISQIRKKLCQQGLPEPIDTIKPSGYVLNEGFALWVRENLSISVPA